MAESILYSELVDQFTLNLKTLKTFVNHVEPVLESKIKDCFDNNKILIAINAIASSKKNNTDFNENELSAINEIEEILLQNVGLKFLEEKDDGKIAFTMKSNSLGKEIYEGIQQFNVGNKQSSLLYESSLVNLIIYFELLLGGLLRKRLYDHPKAFGIQNKSLTLEEIRQLGTLGNAEGYLIEKEVENIMRGSFDEWKKFINIKLKVQFDFIDCDDPVISEIYQSRNLLVHNGGVVNNIYNSNVAPQYKKEMGSSLDITKEYLNNSIIVLERTGLMIALEIWKNGEKRSGDRPDCVFDLAFKYLDNEQWQIAKTLFRFILSEKSISSKLRLLSQINYWQAVKWAGEYDKIKDEVAEQDFSDKQEIFLLCLMAIKDEYEQFFALLPTLVPKSLSIDELKEWPIFREIRNRPEFDEFIKINEKKKIEKTKSRKSKSKDKDKDDMNNTLENTEKIS